jgi:hypothetical protein
MAAAFLPPPLLLLLLLLLLHAPGPRRLRANPPINSPPRSDNGTGGKSIYGARFAGARGGARPRARLRAGRRGAGQGTRGAQHTSKRPLLIPFSCCFLHSAVPALALCNHV